jgi:hypothetical protein
MTCKSVSWALQGSNLRPPPCKGGPGRDAPFGVVACSPVDLRLWLSDRAAHAVLSGLVTRSAFASRLHAGRVGGAIAPISTRQFRADLSLA